MRKHLLAIAAVLSAACSASAQSFNIDIDATGGTWGGAPLSSYGGAIEQPGRWLTLGLAGAGGATFANLNDIFDTPTTVSISTDATALTASNISTTFSFDANRMLDDCSVRGGPHAITVNGLSTGIYRVAVFAVNLAGFPQTVDISPAFTGPINVLGPLQDIPSLGITHAEFLVATAGSFTITVSNGPTGTTNVQGLQIRRLSSQNTRLFVDDTAPPGGDGATWVTAINRLEDALDAAAISLGVNEVWVAAGTYKPTTGADRAASFNLSSTRVFGGFVGTESTLAQRTLPIPTANASVLSGDIGSAGVASDNAYHVVRADGASATGTLDGFTITAGNANGASAPNADGGGLLINAGASPNVRNCTFTGNAADFGAAVSNFSGSGTPRFAHCVFLENTANVSGGGVYLQGAPPGNVYLANCRFLANRAMTGAGGAAYVVGFPVAFVNSEMISNNATQGGAVQFSSSSGIASRLSSCTIIRNTAGTVGGVNVASVHSVGMTNSILYDNTDTNASTSTQQANVAVVGGPFTPEFSCIQAYSIGLGGTGNFSTLPLFVDANGADNLFGTLDDNTRPAPGTSTIDAGSNFLLLSDLADLDADTNTSELVPLDLDGNARLQNLPGVPDSGQGTAPIVDVGAYEALPPPPCPADFNTSGSITVQDIFDFLAAYFAGAPAADFNGVGGVTVQDIFDFLAAYFAGC